MLNSYGNGQMRVMSRSYLVQAACMQPYGMGAAFVWRTAESRPRVEARGMHAAVRLHVPSMLLSGCVGRDVAPR